MDVGLIEALAGGYNQIPVRHHGYVMHVRVRTVSCCACIRQLYVAFPLQRIIVDHDVGRITAAPDLACDHPHRRRLLKQLFRLLFQPQRLTGIVQCCYGFMLKQNHHVHDVSE